MEYIALEYDRSHLDQPAKYQQSELAIDYYDICLLTLNFLALTSILAYYLSTPPTDAASPKRVQEDIVIRASERTASEIPYFVFNRPGKKNKSKEHKEGKEHHREFNPQTQFSGYHLVELKCLKCNYSTDVYEPKSSPEPN